MKYAELHCKTNFSFLEGASHADELVQRAAELGYHALAITDRNSLAGVVRAHAAAKDLAFKLIIGAEVTPVDAPPVVLWATDRASYGRLSRLLTVGRRRTEKGHCELTFDDIAEHSEGLLAGVVSFDTNRVVGVERSEPPDRLSSEACLLGARFTRPQPPSLLNDRNEKLNNYRTVFEDRCYLLAELHRGADDQQKLNQLIQQSKQIRIPLVAAGDVHYHTAERIALQHVLTAIRHGTTVAEAGELLLPNAQRHLQLLEQRTATFAAEPDALHRTIEVADRCTFSLDELRYEYPEELAPRGQTPMEYLQTLTWRGARERYPNGIPDKVRKLIQHELELIADLRYEAYFLTVWDLVRFARWRNILCQGRGSAANSAVCFSLGVTSVDPDQTDVLFERFMSRERNEAPDIDVDFEHERREEVLQYLYEKYGRERAGIAATVITYRSRSAIRDVGKALGLSLDRVDALAKQVEGYRSEPNLDGHSESVGIDPESTIGKQLIFFVNELIGFPRHLSQHVGGMVMTQGPLCELVPIENAAMADRTVIQWDKDDLDELGILKVDCLSLGMLTAIHKCFDLVSEKGVRTHLPERPEGCFAQMSPDPFFTLANIPPGDSDVYDMICRADTMGVFQIESRAQMSMLPRLKPRCYYDLVIEVAIVRPGPIQGNMVHPYLRRRAGEEVVVYPNDEIRDVLHKTMGVPIFQEQAMRLAVVAAGFTPGEADQLRRAMGAWRRPGLIDNFRRKLLDGMRARGLSQEFAEQVFNQIRGFGEYGFPESHAASFALLVYVSAWLKHYYPAAFTASLINSQPMGFYAPAQLIRDAREHDVEVLPVDVNHSDWDCTLEELRNSDCGLRIDQGNSFSNQQSAISNQQLLRLGFRLLVGFPHAAAVTIEQARADGPFRSLDDFTRRTRLSRAVITKLTEADAFKSLARDARSALWQALGQESKKKPQPLFDALSDCDETDVELPSLALEDEVLADYQTTGLSLRAHPISFYRSELKRLRITPAGKLVDVPNNRQVRVAGLVLLRQRPSTAKGITFVTLEDETGIANLVVKQPIWQRYYKIARRSPAWIAHGRLECKNSVIHVVVNRLEDLSHCLSDVNVKSRDFR